MDELNNIPKEIIDQYPYGQFPIRYTRLGQESIRKESENRYLNVAPPQNPEEQKNNINILDYLPLIELMSGKKDSKEMFKILSKLLFKDNKDMETIFNLLSPSSTKSQEIKPQDPFPNTNKVNISSLKRI